MWKSTQNLSLWTIRVNVCDPAMYVNDVVITVTILFIYFYFVFFFRPAIALGHGIDCCDFLLENVVLTLDLSYNIFLGYDSYCCIKVFTISMMGTCYLSIENSFLLESTVLMDSSWEGIWRWVNVLDGSLVLMDMK